MAFNLNNSSKNRTSRSRTQVMSEINVTPLVDVMLVLLIIFMVTSPMLIAGIKVDLPETNSTPASGDDEPLAITVDKSGKVYLMETEIIPGQLVDKLKAVTAHKMETRIFVRGDKNASYGDIIKVVSEINNAGFNKVALVTNIKYNDK